MSKVSVRKYDNVFKSILQNQVLSLFMCGADSKAKRKMDVPHLYEGTRRTTESSSRCIFVKNISLVDSFVLVFFPIEASNSLDPILPSSLFNWYFGCVCWYFVEMHFFAFWLFAIVMTSGDTAANHFY